MRLFRHRMLRALFPPGVAAIFIAALALAPGLMGTGSVFRLFLGALAIGAAGALALFAVMKAIDWFWRRGTPGERP